jgi:hypothetical protein
MSMNRRTVILGPLSSFALGILAAGMAGGCSGQPETGTQAVESPQVQKNREESIKDAMRKGAYGGVKIKDKSAPAN